MKSANSDTRGISRSTPVFGIHSVTGSGQGMLMDGFSLSRLNQEGLAQTISPLRMPARKPASRTNFRSPVAIANNSSTFASGMTVFRAGVSPLNLRAATSMPNHLANVATLVA